MNYRPPKLPKHKMISFILGDISGELTHAKLHKTIPELVTLAFEAEQPLLDLIGGILARYEGRILINDPHFPSKIIPRDPPDEGTDEEWAADEKAGFDVSGWK